MSASSAALFSWVQGAGFYVDAHAEAVNLVPPGHGDWLDVGCGPGLVARLAAPRGYTVIGVDSDPHMVRRARQLARGVGSCTFETRALDSVAAECADVVSASSLLCVLPEPSKGLHTLWSAVRPGGKLLVLETTEEMIPDRARAVMSVVRPGRRRVLEMWARARHGHALDASMFDSLPAASRAHHLLLDGLVAAWIFTKKQSRRAPLDET